MSGFLTVAEAARAGGLTESALRARIQRGNCPFPISKFGHAVLIPTDTFEQWLATREEAQP